MGALSKSEMESGSACGILFPVLRLFLNGLPLYKDLLPGKRAFVSCRNMPYYPYNIPGRPGRVIISLSLDNFAGVP